MAVNGTQASWSKGISNADLYSSQTSGPQAQQEMDKDAFLQLLVTQMKYQDPMNPTQDTEYLAQLAQFTALEQMQNIAGLQEQQSAYELVGKYVVDYQYDPMTGNGNLVEGRVEGITTENGKTYAIVNGLTIAVEDIDEVFEDYSELTQFMAMNDALAIAQNVALIGKNVDYNIYNDEGEIVGTGYGEVSHMTFDENGIAKLIINGESVLAGQITNIYPSDYNKPVTTLPEEVDVEQEVETPIGEI